MQSSLRSKPGASALRVASCDSLFEYEGKLPPQAARRHNSCPATAANSPGLGPQPGPAALVFDELPSWPKSPLLLASSGGLAPRLEQPRPAPRRVRSLGELRPSVPPLPKGEWLATPEQALQQKLDGQLVQLVCALAQKGQLPVTRQLCAQLRRRGLRH